MRPAAEKRMGERKKWGSNLWRGGKSNGSVVVCGKDAGFLEELWVKR